MEQTIPVVDLDDFRSPDPARRAEFVQTIGDALVEYGFVAIENHRVDPRVLDSTYTTMKEVFDLPPSVKGKYEDRRIGRQRGYTPFGKEKAKGTDAADLKEFWHVGPNLPPTTTSFERIPRNIWPAEVPDFESHSMALWENLHDCGRAIRGPSLSISVPPKTPLIQ